LRPRPHGVLVALRAVGDRHRDRDGDIADDVPLRVVPTPAGLRVDGELDLATARVLAAHLDPLPGGAGDVVVDVSGIRFVDSTGLSVLVQAHHTARSAGRRLVLAAPSARVRRLLEITALDDVLTVIDAGAVDGPEGVTA
jgi:anti-anti-sigma factor